MPCWVPKFEGIGPGKSLNLMLRRFGKIFNSGGFDRNVMVHYATFYGPVNKQRDLIQEIVVYDF